MLLNGWLENTHAESGWINIIQQTILDSNSSNMLKVPWKNYFTTKKHLQSGGFTTWGYTRIGAKQWKNSNITLSIVSSEVHSRFTCGPHSAHDPRIHRGKPIHSQDRGLVFKIANVKPCSSYRVSVACLGKHDFEPQLTHSSVHICPDLSLAVKGCLSCFTPQFAPRLLVPVRALWNLAVWNPALAPQEEPTAVRITILCKYALHYMLYEDVIGSSKLLDGVTLLTTVVRKNILACTVSTISWEVNHSD